MAPGRVECVLKAARVRKLVAVSGLMGLAMGSEASAAWRCNVLC